MGRIVAFSTTVFIICVCIFLFTFDAFADCMLDAEFTGAAGSSEPAISVSSDGKTVGGYLKVINSDISACPVKVDLRIYNAAEKKIASKAVSFGSIAAGAETTKKFTLATTKKLWGRSLTAVINPTTVREDGDSYEEDDGTVSTEMPEQPLPDLAAAWENLTLSNNSRKVDGDLVISNIGEQESEKFGVWIWIYNSEGSSRRLIKKINVAGIKAGESKTLMISYRSVKSLEWGSILARVDHLNEIKEPDKENNDVGASNLFDWTSCSEGMYIHGLETFSKASKIPKAKVGSFLDFGIHQFTLINCGDTDLTITEISTDSDEFLFDGGGVIPPKGFKEMSFKFHPAEKGTCTATLTIKSDDPAEPVKTVAVIGTGL